MGKRAHALYKCSSQACSPHVHCNLVRIVEVTQVAQTMVSPVVFVVLIVGGARATTTRCARARWVMHSATKVPAKQ